MDINTNCSLAHELAARMRAEADDLTRRWLDRIVARVEIEPNRVFPTEELLDHVPLLMERIGDYLENPAEDIAGDSPVIGKALELGRLRYSQGFDAHEILKEYEILGGVLFQFLVRTVDEIDHPCTRAELLACAHRLFRAVAVIQQLTTSQYLRLAAERVSEREERLRSFNRMVTHELKNRIGAVLGAGQLLADPDISADPDRRARFAAMVTQNAEGMQDVLQNLLELSRMDNDTRQQRNVPLPRVAAEVCRQLREMSQARNVAVHVDPLPEVEVNAGAVELCLTNYLSNAIKYSDPQKDTRWVRVTGTVVSTDSGARELVISVDDNGLGVPPDARGELFSRFYRAHGSTVTGVEGTGLGLSIVRETMESMGGRTWAEFDGTEGARFLLALPVRRATDRDGERAPAPA
ncbi:sensor histidine kinase [Longimicrobium terrae]|uniref:histidine kinase n=1 Tax=Longimicrobium terrae TaxID=1639882 RepID=A0A841H6N6_9BACT|nr:sensor histidine kinase [Longimicrobium terrae]MBB4638273.1 signal transduction histidine kinase [Longimicrobium terrae]MBB6073757.1 signal transduction histidine kinase [Longimicrobium terrae]NNC30250.1 sensor histidine kinase [Longimicrobium terrae]